MIIFHMIINMQGLNNLDTHSYHRDLLNIFQQFCGLFLHYITDMFYRSKVILEHFDEAQFIFYIFTFSDLFNSISWFKDTKGSVCFLVGSLKFKSYISDNNPFDLIWIFDIRLEIFSIKISSCPSTISRQDFPSLNYL